MSSLPPPPDYFADLHEAKEQARQEAAEHGTRCHDGYLTDDEGAASPCQQHRPREYAVHWARTRAEGAS